GKQDNKKQALLASNICTRKYFGPGKPYTCDIVIDSVVLGFFIEAERILSILGTDHAVEDFLWHVRIHQNPGYFRIELITAPAALFPSYGDQSFRVSEIAGYDASCHDIVDHKS
ncbi:hypothetical protein Tco_1190884, partial [Tanacetum coccineum]